MVTLARRASRIPFAPVVAVLFGIVAAILMAAVPQWLFEAGVVKSGLPGIFAAATPPLGLLARLLAMALSFLGVTLLLWAFLGPLTAKLEGRARARTPWRDAGYDAPVPEDSDLFIAPRKPIFAPEELGAPLMSDEAIAAMPEPVVEPAVPVPEKEEAPEPLVSPSLDNSIAALIRRLEDGLARRKATLPPTPGGAPVAAAPEAPPADGIATTSEMSNDDEDDGIARSAGNLFRRRALG